MAAAALLSALHALALAIGFTAIVLRGRALAGALDSAAWKRLLAADDAWGVAALLWLATGLLRIFWGGKEPDFYWSNGLFWTKLGLFAVIFVLELRPMTTFIRVRIALRKGAPLPSFPIETYRRINAAETALVVTIVFVAAFMARGAWMF